MQTPPTCRVRPIAGIDLGVGRRLRSSCEVEGRRDDVGAKALISINELVPGLRADEIIGTEGRSSDDKIVGEIRNFVFGTKDRRDYAVVASGGFFTIGKDSFVVPIRDLSVTQERDSFLLQITEAAVKTVPLMPDYDYQWHSDAAWLSLNDAHFE